MRVCVGKRGDIERKGNFLLVSLFHLWGTLLQERNFSASLSTAVLRDCNNTDLPHKDVVGLFMCKALGKVQRDEYYYYHLDLIQVFPCPQTLQMGWRWSLEMTFKGQLFLMLLQENNLEFMESVVLELNRDEGLKRVQLLGQTNANIPSPGEIPAWLFVPKGKTGHGDLWWSQKTVLTSLNLQPKCMF